MKNKTLLLLCMLVHATIICAQQNNEQSDPANLSDKEKIKILVQQIELRDNRIADMSKEMERLNKKKNKESKSPNTNSKKLESTLEELAQEKEAKEMLQEKVNTLQSQIDKTANSNAQSDINVTSVKELRETQEQLKDAEYKLKDLLTDNQVLKTQIESLKLAIEQSKNTISKDPNTGSEWQKQARDNQDKINLLESQLAQSKNEIAEKQNQILNLQSELQQSRNNVIAQNENNRKQKKYKPKSDQVEIETTPIKGKNYFYITASQNLDVENNYGVEIGGIKNFNKRSSKPIKVGLDVAYLSANLINVDLDAIDEALEKPAGAVGIKIGPNIGIRLVKGININLNYRYFPAANLSIVDDETSIEYKGFHTAGATAKVGPIMARFELDITNSIDNSSTISTSPISLYLGLMF